MEKTGEHQPQRTLSPLLRGLLRLKFWLAEHLRLSERHVTLIWAALIGVLGALASEGFRKSSEVLQHFATGSNSGIISSFERLSWWQRLAVPTAGGLLAGLTLWFGNRLFASVRQKTTTDYMEAIVVGSGIISVRASIVKSVSALFSISTGTSIGREGPLVQLSSLVASLVGRIRRFPIPQRRHLVACGAAAGIASAYKAPIAASLFVAEIILGTVVVESLGPLILASVVAAFVSQFLSGSEPLYKSPGFDLHTRWEIIPLSCVGIVLGFLAPAYLRFLRLAERLFSKIDIPVPFKLALGGAIVGSLAILNPEVCGNGQELLRSLFHQNWLWDGILAIVLLKLVATASAFGSGVVGGVFTPTLFIGAAIGVMYGQMILLVAPGLRADPAMYGFVGMGSFIAATTGAPLMAILMAFELTLDYSITPYLMVNCVVAYYCSGIFEKRFMYGESLERKGAAFFNQQLAQVNLQDLVRLDPITLPKNATFAQIAEAFVQHRYQHIYIIDHENRLLGAISLHDVKSFLDRPELESVVIAADIMDEDFPRVSTGQGMNEALHQFSAARSERLPVVDSLHSKRLIGSISKTDIILHLAGEQAGTGTNRSF
ncbi:MAG TPA: ClcB-like voltage-gated chloride channel protein [Chthoniobacterales bacterium]|jgi:chloride channel protein, CIC family|nr:ClcB-like voltage-gated chloride channel protein [Chthoniobacterales bacterium]